MILELETAPTVEPVSLTEAKVHLRLAVGATAAAAYTTEDTELGMWITAARSVIEKEIGRALITQSKVLYLDAWPDENYIRIPYPPLQTAVVTYRLEDDDGYDNTLSTIDVDTVSDPGRVILQPNESWPTGTLYPDKPIKISFDCGYGDEAADVPKPVKAAILLKISDLYENRGSVYVGVTATKFRDAIDSLLTNYHDYTVWK